MTEIINHLNKKYNKMIEELFEEVLCDKCRRVVKIGNIQGKITNILNNEEILLCKDCHDNITTQIKKS